MSSVAVSHLALAGSRQVMSARSSCPVLRVVAHSSPNSGFRVSSASAFDSCASNATVGGEMTMYTKSGEGRIKRRAVRGEVVRCFSSFSFSYLSRAIVWARTLREAHPEWEVWVIIVDRPPSTLSDIDFSVHFDSVMYADQLGIDNFASWMFKHDIVEACTAVKGAMLSYLLVGDVDKVIYFDPDIAIFHRLDSVIALLDEHSIALTPHQIAANHSDGYVRDNELTSLKYGVFNLGFVAVKNDEVGRAFSEWWARCLYMACYDEPENGIFTDQKWCDLVPALFDRVVVIRDPGCNVASWNISTRRVKIVQDGSILVNGSPLKFYHYTKINSLGDLMTEKYAGDNVEIMEVWNWYKRAVSSCRVEGIPSGYWFYGQFDNGFKIQKAIRILFRERRDLYERFPNPYSTGSGSFYNWLLAEAPEKLAGTEKAGFEAI